MKASGKGFSAAPFNTFTIQSKAGAKGGYNLCEVCIRLKSNSSFLKFSCDSVFLIAV